MNDQGLRDVAFHLLGAQQSKAIYPEDHPRVNTAIRDLHLRLTELLAEEPEVKLAVVDSELVLVDRPVPMEGELLAGLARLLRSRGVDTLVLRRGLRRWEVGTLVEALATPAEELEPVGGVGALLERAQARHVYCGALNLSAPGKAKAGDSSLPTVWRLYTEGINAIRRLQAHVGGELDAESLTRIVGVATGLAEAARDNAEALVLIHSLKSTDEYSCAHSLDVTLLTLTLARQLGLPDPGLVEVALAALMHDIGKALVPSEVLDKPGRLTAEEWDLVQRHNLDGARMLLRCRAATDLAVVVAYEHQLAHEPDDPDHGRWPMHLVSELVRVADVYDALRSNRPYREALAPDVAMRIMEEEAATEFDADIFAAFRRMLGHYPPGTCVRLSDGSIALSRSADAEHVDRPEVLVVRNAEGTEIEPPLPIALADTPGIEAADVVDGEALGDRAARLPLTDAWKRFVTAGHR